MLRYLDVHKRYGDAIALDGFSLEVRRGETVVLMGPSGCGKFTALRCVNRLTEPDCGEVWWNGESVLRMDAVELRRFRRRVGFVFQHFNLIERLDVLDNVRLGPVLAGGPAADATARAQEALARVGLAWAARRLPSELSGGERQRVGIARALAMRPELLLWDEPTASLDPILVGEVLDVMEDLVRTAGTTMLIVTHEVGFARRVADRIVLMDRGRIVEQGPPAEVLARPRSEVGRKYRRLLVA